MYSEEMRLVCLAKHLVLINMCSRLGASSDMLEALTLMIIVRQEVEKLEFQDDK